MPVRWDTEARYTVSSSPIPSPHRDHNTNLHSQLLLTILSQHPNILSKIDADAISNSWPGNGTLTARAVQEQVKFFRNELKSGKFGGGGASSTPSRSVSTAKSKPKVSTPSVTPVKRANGTNARTPTSSAKKRRVTPRKKDSDESEELELSSEEEDPGADETDEDSPLAKVPTSSERRTLPARSKSRSKSYAAESDSEGRDAGARDTDSGVDSEFSLSKVDEERAKKGRSAVGTLLRKMMAAKEGQNGDGGRGEDEGDEQERPGGEDVKVEGVSDAESGTTKRTSWKSALEEI